MASQDITSTITVRSRSDLTSKLTVMAHGQFAGDVTIQAVEANDLASQISVVRSDSIQSKFYVYSDEYPNGSQRKSKMFVLYRDNMPSTLEVYSDNVIENPGWGTATYGLQKRSRLRVANRSDLTSQLTVGPNGIMYGTTEVAQPPTITINAFPIQDAFVRSGSPTLNYGTQQTMLVGYSDHFLETYRSTVQFDISAVPTNVEILSATLKLYNTREDAIGQNLSVMKAASSWTEDGVTWKNQPFIGETLGHMTIDHVGYHDFDILNLLKSWVDGSEENNGIELRATDETALQYSQFYTKEGPDQPVLEVVYHNPVVPSFGRTDMTSKLSVPAYNFLPSKINIPIYDKNRDLHGHIRVKEPNTMFGNIGVSRPDLPAQITARQSDKSTITASIDVRISTVFDQESHIGVNRPETPSQIYVPYRLDTPSQMAVRAMGHDDLDSQITVNRPNQVSTILVRYRIDIPSQITVRRSGKTQLQTHMGISRPDLPSKIFALYRNDITAAVAVRASTNEDFPSHVGVNRPDLPSLIQVRYSDKSDITSQIVVRRFDIDQISALARVSRPDLPSTIQAKIHSSIQGAITVRQSNKDTLSSGLFVLYHRQITSTINVIGASMLPSHMHVNSGYLKSVIRIPTHESHDLYSKMLVIYKRTADLTSQIAAGHWTDLEGTMFVMATGYDDLTSKIKVVIPGAYAFIL